MIDGQFVADSIETLTQQSVVVERANQILHDVVLTGCHIEESHLLLQLVIERGGLTIHHLFAFLSHSVATMINRQFIVVATDIAQCIVESRLAFLTLRQHFVVVVSRVSTVVVVTTIGIVLMVRVVVRRLLLQGRIVVHLHIHPIHQLRQWQLHQRGLQQLLVGYRLRQLLLL